MSVFKTQSLLSIILKTNYAELGTATVKKILYTKPNGQEGSWDADISGMVLVYNVSNGDIDQVGLWKFQAYIEVGGLKGFGEIVEKRILAPLT